MASNLPISMDEEDKKIEKIPMTQDTYDSGNSPSNGGDLMPQKVGRNFEEIMQEFTQRTTFHGTKLIFKERVGIARRVIWFILFLTCTVLMGVQIVNRLLHYYSYPVTVNFNVHFEKVPSFPTVTICNQNTFRATEASSRGWYELLGDLNNVSATMSKEKLEDYNATTLSLEELYLATAHKKEDFIVSCEWQNQICGPQNFTQVMTDQGVCYSFNSNRSSPLSTAWAGPGTGLKLTLNIERYDYIPGPYNPAGMKMLLHNFDQFPRVGELGLSVAAGTHAFVGIELLKVNNLPKPHGTCRRAPSELYDHYSPEACQLACMTPYLDELCSCRHVYLPHDKDYPPICSLHDFVTCLRGYMASARDHARDRCDCPPPCDLLQHEPVVSYASNSLFATNRSLTPSILASLRKRYLQARETTSRLDRGKWQQYTTITNDLRTSFRNLHSEMVRGIHHSLANQRSELNAVHGKTKNAYTKLKYFLDWQASQVEKNFEKAKEEMEERTMYHLGFGYEEFAYQAKTRINQLDHSSWNVTVPEDARTAMYIELSNMLAGRLMLAKGAHESYNQLHNAYSEIEPTSATQFQNESADNTNNTTYNASLNESIASYEDFSSSDSDTLLEDILNIKGILRAYISLAEKYYYANKTNPEEVENYNSQILEWGPKFSQSKRVFYNDSVDLSIKIMRQKLHELERTWKDFEETLNPMIRKLDILIESLKRHQIHSVTILEQTIAKAEHHISPQNVTRLQVAEAFTSDQFLKGVSEFTGFLNELKSRGQEVYSGWSALNISTKAILETLVSDKNRLEQHQHENMTLFIQIYSMESAELRRNYTHYRDNSNVQYKVSQVDGQFVRNFQRMVNLMKDFIANSDIDEAFMKNNFLRLDVYYKGTGYEEITQQPEFDVFALLCDIGATMAFYLGASVLTVFELLDLGLHHFIYKLTHNDKFH